MSGPTEPPRQNEPPTGDERLSRNADPRYRDDRQLRAVGFLTGVAAPRSIAIGDLNGDRVLDIAVGGDAGV